MKARNFIFNLRFFRQVAYACFLGLLLGCDGDTLPSSDIERIKKLGVIRIATFLDPTTYYKENVAASGFEYQLGYLFADYLGVSPEFVLADHPSKIQEMLTRDQADIAAGLTIIPPALSRESQIRYGPPYFAISYHIVYSGEEDSYPRLTDSTGRLTVLYPSHLGFLIEKIKQTYPQLDWVASDQEHGLKLVATAITERVMAVVPSNLLNQIDHIYPGKLDSYPLLEEGALAWTYTSQKDDSLRAAVIQFFAMLQTEGKIAALIAQQTKPLQTNYWFDQRVFIERIQQCLVQWKRFFLTAELRHGIDWRLLAAISYQESHWDKDAVSYSGVRGLMMLTNDTASYLGVTNRQNPQESIWGGGRYMRLLMRRIPSRIAPSDRLYFAIAAYNIGFGHLEDARVLTERAGDNPDLWHDVKKYLPRLADPNWCAKTKYGCARGYETIAFVANVRRYYRTLVWLDFVASR